MSNDPNVMRDAMLGRMNAAQARPTATVMPPRCTDDEASAILDELSKLQGLMVMQCQRGPEWMAAADLVQRTRVLIIERCKRPSNFDVRFDREPDAVAQSTPTHRKGE